MANKNLRILISFITLASLVMPAKLGAASLAQTLDGKILLQVQEHGEAWYVKNSARYYLKDGAAAYQIMRELGLGITDADLNQIPSVTDTSAMKAASSVCAGNSLASRVRGNILLQVQEHGEAWYVDTTKCRRIYMKDGDAAYQIMRYLSLGITDADLALIPAASSSSPVVSAASTVVDTHQTACYGETSQISCPSSGALYYGQDAQYSGTQPSYTDNGDGTVTDNITGLMWLKDAGNKFAYYDGIEYAKSLSYAGYSDWRVPTIKELYSLMDFRGIDPNSESTSTGGLTPFIDTDHFVFNYGDISKGDRIIDSQWITSNVYTSKVMNGQECFFGVNFADGRIKCYPTVTTHNNGYYLRLVRGNAYGVNRFTDNGNGTVTDASSGMTWQQSDSGKGMNWGEALSYCENLSLAGYSDWRLPNVKELQYIADYSRGPDKTGSPAIDPVFSTGKITNEAGATDYPYFWSSTTHRGFTSDDHAAYVSFGRALGYMNGQWIDVHGAGAQRSDPKIGSASDYPTGHGPQGDAIRVFNYARCVRGEASPAAGDSYTGSSGQQASGSSQPAPPAEAVTACSSKTSGAVCSFQAPQSVVSGTCHLIGSSLACAP